MGELITNKLIEKVLETDLTKDRADQIIRQIQESPMCPNCMIPMDEEFEDEINEFGELTGLDYEIYLCPKCGYKFFI